MNALSIILILLAATGMAQTDQCAIVAENEHLMGGSGCTYLTDSWPDSVDDCETQCEGDNACDTFVYTQLSGVLACAFYTCYNHTCVPVDYTDATIYFCNNAEGMLNYTCAQKVPTDMPSESPVSSEPTEVPSQMPSSSGIPSTQPEATTEGEETTTAAPSFAPSTAMPTTVRDVIEYDDCETLSATGGGSDRAQDTWNFQCSSGKVVTGLAIRHNGPSDSHRNLESITCCGLREKVTGTCSTPWSRYNIPVGGVNGVNDVWNTTCPAGSSMVGFFDDDDQDFSDLDNLKCCEVACSADYEQYCDPETHLRADECVVIDIEDAGDFECPKDYTLTALYDDPEDGTNFGQIRKMKCCAIDPSEDENTWNARLNQDDHGMSMSVVYIIIMAVVVILCMIMLEDKKMCNPADWLTCSWFVAFITGDSGEKVKSEVEEEENVEVGGTPWLFRDSEEAGKVPTGV